MDGSGAMAHTDSILYTVAFNPSVKVLVVMRKLSLCMTVRARLKDLGLQPQTDM